MKRENFQIIVLAIFVAAAVFGILVFSGIIPIGGGDDNGPQGSVVLWGTVKSQIVNSLLNDFNQENPDFSVRYVEKSVERFDKDLLEALASGKGPDMFFITDDLVYKYSDKIYTIPYQSFPQSAFNSTFAGAGRVFLSSKGISAFPLTIDPVVMYFNRSILDENAVASPPLYWDEFSGLSSLLNKKDERGIIKKSMVALGGYSNISHAKEILSLLFMQTGNPIIAEKTGSYSSFLNGADSKYNLGAVLKFYTDFADPLKGSYSWNKSFSNSSDAFSREDLAFYFGYASELESLVKKNPNQNLLVTSVPQIRNSSFKLTTGKITGIAISSFSKNFNTAFTASALMSKGRFASGLATKLGIAPARLEFLKNMPTDAYGPIFYNSAFIARSWVDPSPESSEDIFKGMVEKVLSNTLSPAQAVSDAGTRLGLLLMR